MANKKYIYFLGKSKEKEQVVGFKPYLRIILKRRVKKIRWVDVWNRRN